MTTFDPQNCLRPAMAITDKADAEQYKAAYIAYIQKALDREPRSDGMTAKQIANANLGYFAGYYSNETRARVERLFNCSHPIFGSITPHGAPTPEQAFEMGGAKA